MAVLGAGVTAHAASALVKGKPEIRSMSALAFGPEGVLFVGDSRAGAVFAIDLGDKTPREVDKPDEVQDVEGKLAALLGATPADVLVHDMAVNPLSKNVYLAVSRGRAQLASEWQLPNDVADATVLVKIDAEQRFSVVDLSSVAHARVDLPNPVDPAKKHGWKDGVSLRTETITDLAYADGALWVAGLSNEEFASTMWRAALPVRRHGRRHHDRELPRRPRQVRDRGAGAGVRAVPAQGQDATCWPPICARRSSPSTLSSLQDKQHVRGRTIGEFGSGNYPLDMVVYKNKDQQKLLIANSNLPFMIVDPKDVEAFEGEITREVRATPPACASSRARAPGSSSSTTWATPTSWSCGGSWAAASTSCRSRCGASEARPPTRGGSWP